MQRLVPLIAPKGWWDFILKSLMVLVLGNLVAMGVVYSVHGFFPSGLRGQLVETTIIALPFTFLFLKVIAYLFELQTKLERLANTDSLTELPNRRAFIEALGQSVAAKDAGYVILADADHFKRINDRFGHDGGDACLRAIAAHLRGVCGPSDHVARIGGEEFAVLIKARDERMARDAAARLVMPIPFCPHGRVNGPLTETVTLSAGCVPLDKMATASQVLARADRMLYQAKAEGRARFVVAALADPKPASVAPAASSLRGSAA